MLRRQIVVLLVLLSAGCNTVRLGVEGSGHCGPFLWPICAASGVVAGAVMEIKKHARAPEDWPSSTPQGPEQTSPKVCKQTASTGHPSCERLHSIGTFEATEVSGMRVPMGHIHVARDRTRRIHDEVKSATLLIELDTPDEHAALSYVLQTTIDCSGGALSIYATTAYESRDGGKILHSKSFAPPLVIDKPTNHFASAVHAVCGI
jgi:hypothetical protein